MKTSSVACRSARTKHCSADVRAIYPQPIKEKGELASCYKSTAQGYFADWDECTDQDAQTVSFFKMLGMTILFISGSPPGSQ